MLGLRKIIIFLIYFPVQNVFCAGKLPEIMQKSANRRFALLCDKAVFHGWYMGVPIQPPIIFDSKPYLLKIVERVLHQKVTHFEASIKGEMFLFLLTYLHTYKVRKVLQFV